MRQMLRRAKHVWSAVGIVLSLIGLAGLRDDVRTITAWTNSTPAQVGAYAIIAVGVAIIALARIPAEEPVLSNSNRRTGIRMSGGSLNIEDSEISGMDSAIDADGTKVISKKLKIK